MNSSFTNTSFARRKSGVKIPLGSDIRKDSAGMDDIAAFWDATEVVPPNSARRSSVGSQRKTRRSSSGRSSNGESEVFDYDTSSSISEDEEDDVETDGEGDVSTSMARSPKNRSPKNRSPRMASPLETAAEVPYDDAAMDFDGGDDFYGGGGVDVSPFAVGESPLRASTGSSRGGSAGRGRRVSFGAGTKEGATSPGKKTPRGRRSSGASGTSTVVATPEMGDMTTPESTPGSVAISTPGSEEFPRGARMQDESYMGGSDEDEDDLVDSDEEGDDRDKSLVASARKRGVAHDDDEDDDDDFSGRRSRRATKGKRFAYWKNERPVYDKGQIVGVLTADPTPRKKKNKQGGLSRHALGPGRKVKAEELPPVQLPRDLSFVETESLDVWDDANDQIKNDRVVCSADSLPEPAQLPITAPRPPNRQAVGSAAQFFAVPSIPNVMSGWLTGGLVLPPEAIKDAEGVGECAQVFFVVDCQEGALEVDYADPKEDTWRDELAQRTLLSKGDSFFIPPGNIYRLENHSKAQEASLCWTIIKPMED